METQHEDYLKSIASIVCVVFVICGIACSAFGLCFMNDSSVPTTMFVLLGLGVILSAVAMNAFFKVIVEISLSLKRLILVTVNKN